MQNIINSLGAGSGIDVPNLISSLVEVERAPVETRLDTNEAKYEAQISAYGALKSAMSELQALVGNVADNDTFNARGVTFPDTDAITPNSIEAGAQVGSYQVEVVDIAQSQSLVLESNEDPDDTLGLTGELTFEFGAWTYSGVDNDIPTTFSVNAERDAFSIDIDTNDSLTSIAEKINDADVGITASVLKIDDNYQLMLNMPSGGSNALRITSDNTASLGVLEFNETTYTDVLETQQGQDAEIEVNGLQIFRSSNDLSDVIEGFNFTLNKSSEGQSINFTVEEDTAVAEQSIRDLIEGFNLFVTTARGITNYSRDEEDNSLIKGDLATDSIAKSLVNRLRQTMISQIDGASGSFDALAGIGIKTNLDGSLAIDETTFTNALQNNFSDIEALFAPTAVTASTRVVVGQGSQIDQTLSGVYAVEITQDATQGTLTGDTLTETFAASVDTSLGDYSIVLNIGGTTTDTLTLTGTYANATELGDALEALINADSNLTENGLKVDVNYLSGTNQYEIVNRRYGSGSTVEISSNGADMVSLGLTTAQTGVEGLDVQGTIDGEEGFGAGQVLLPSIDSPAYGLTFTVLNGAASEDPFNLNFSRGVAGELNLLISRFLSNSGPIAAREDSIETQLERIDDDRADLDRRIEAYEARLTAQFIAMERILNSLSSTDSALDGLIDRLPFTASRDR